MTTLFVRGDIFTAKADALVNPVNCKGVMGAGLAKAFKERFPAMFSTYEQMCREHIVQMGKVNLLPFHTPKIILFPTKYHWRDASHIADITKGLADLADQLERWRIYFDVQRVAIPQLGCGLGGLTWPSVKPFLLQYLAPSRVECVICQIPHA